MSTRRATRTPGAKEPEPTTQEQADQAFEEILSDTSALVPAEQFDAVAQKLAEAEAKIKALEAQSKAPAQPFQSQATEVKRTQNVLTEHGWTSMEE